MSLWLSITLVCIIHSAGAHCFLTNSKKNGGSHQYNIFWESYIHQYRTNTHCSYYICHKPHTHINTHRLSWSGPSTILLITCLMYRCWEVWPISTNPRGLYLHQLYIIVHNYMLKKNKKKKTLKLRKWEKKKYI